MTFGLWHGDCLDLLPGIPDGSIDMVFADLPYGVTANKWDSVIPFEPLWKQLLRAGKRNAAFVFTATQPFATALINSQPRLFRYDLVWDKKLVTGHLNANRCPLRRHELVLMFARCATTYSPQKTQGKAFSKGGGKKSTNYGQYVTATERAYDGARFPTSIIDCQLVNAQRIESMHPTQKPVALLEWLVKTYTNPGDIVLDPTRGSGTTGVACINTGRQFIGIEKDATYYATAQRRLAETQPPLAIVS